MSGRETHATSRDVMRDVIEGRGGVETHTPPSQPSLPQQEHRRRGDGVCVFVRGGGVGPVPDSNLNCSVSSSTSPAP